MAPMILAVTLSTDIAADLVIRHLVSGGVPFLRVNADLIGTPRKHFGFDCEEPILEYDEATIPAGAVAAVWARRFSTPASIESVEEKYRPFVMRELRDTMDAFLETVNGLVINSYDADRRAGNRLWQSMAARSVDLKVPRTLVTQHCEKAKRFVIDQRTVTKAVSYGVLSAQDDEVVYTNSVDEFEMFDGLECCPVLLQSEVEKKFEWRVTTVGDKVFSARTRLGAEIDQTDWRRSADVTALFEPRQLPNDVSEKILRLCSVSGIHFGAHDLIETVDGEFYFLETNPAGQWGWLEITLGMPIGEALASLLIAGKQHGYYG